MSWYFPEPSTVPKRSSALLLAMLSLKPLSPSCFCMTCSMSSRCLLPAVVITVSDAVLPFFAQTPEPFFFQPSPVIRLVTLSGWGVYSDHAVVSAYLAEIGGLRDCHA